MKTSRQIESPKGLACLLVLMAAICAQAQNQLAVVEKACGPLKTQFEVKRTQSPNPLRQTEPGKARVYFIQDLGVTNCVDCVIIRIGVDGDWVGANQRNSYFSVSMEPGEHRLCANPQPGYLQRLVGLARFTAEAGKIYYYRIRMFRQEREAMLDFEPIDSDQAEYLIGSSPVSVSYPKK